LTNDGDQHHPDRSRLLRTPDAEPPESTGRKLAVVPHDTTAEPRITLDEYEGHPYVQLRAWERGATGWFPTRKDVTIRLRELQAVADALREALEIAGVLNAKGERHPVGRSPLPPWDGDDEDIAD